MASSSSLKLGDYSGAFKWIQYNHKMYSKGKEEGKGVCLSDKGLGRVHLPLGAGLVRERQFFSRISSRVHF